jgi:dethiobiotin synthetase
MTTSLPSSLPPVIVVTGTDTDVGKTIATAALAVLMTAEPVVYKPVQTGASTSTTADVDVVRQLAGIVDVREGARLDDPLAPSTAARRSGTTLPTVAEHAQHIDQLVAAGSSVLVEGAGGLLVELDNDGGDLAGLGSSLASPCGFVIVCRAGLGTLNHARLTVEALRDRGLTVLGLVIGSWPAEPDLAAWCNLEDLPRVTSTPVLGRIPQGAGNLTRQQFRAAAPGWFA